MFPRRRMIRRQTRRIVRRRMLFFGRPVGTPLVVIGLILILLVIALFFRVMRARGQPPLSVDAANAAAVRWVCPECALVPVG
ncbi:MAG: hypothetical protein IPK52_20270 [Chloroflexi bacterium]|nr:hypothetical protein [Chloroflexota bacterium]